MLKLFPFVGNAIRHTTDIFLSTHIKTLQQDISKRTPQNGLKEITVVKVVTLRNSTEIRERVRK